MKRIINFGNNKSVRKSNVDKPLIQKSKETKDSSA